jgi:hypothetical protein
MYSNLATIRTRILPDARVTVHVDIERLLRLQLLVAERAWYVSLLMHRLMLLQHVFTVKLLVANLTGKLTLPCCT